MLLAFSSILISIVFLSLSIDFTCKLVIIEKPISHSGRATAIYCLDEFCVYTFQHKETPL